MQHEPVGDNDYRGEKAELPNWAQVYAKPDETE